MRTTFFSILIVLCLAASAQAQTTDSTAERSLYDLAVETILEDGLLLDQQLSQLKDCRSFKLLMAWPFARHGQVFDNKELDTWLRADSRYKPLQISHEQVADLLTPADQDNLWLATAWFEKSCNKDGADETAVPPSTDADDDSSDEDGADEDGDDSSDNEPAPPNDAADPPHDDPPAPSTGAADPSACPQCPQCETCPTCTACPPCEKVDEGKIVAKFAFGYQLEDVALGGFLLPHRLKALTCNQLSRLQLTVSARHGYVPLDKAEADFFSEQAWYAGNPKLGDAGVKAAFDVRDMVNLTRLRDARRRGGCGK